MQTAPNARGLAQPTLKQAEELLSRGRTNKVRSFVVDPTDCLQSVFDDIASGNDLANIYNIGLQPGIYESNAADGFTLARSNVRVYSVVPRAACLVNRKPIMDSTLRVGISDGTLQSNVYIDGLTCVALGTNAPAPGVGIGYEVGSNHNDIWLRDCEIIGFHDGIQFFGGAVTRGVAGISNSLIRSYHDAVCVKGNGTVYSNQNMIRVSDTGGCSPWLYDYGTWAGHPSNTAHKSTGIHVSYGFFQQVSDATLDILYSIGDTIKVYNNEVLGVGKQVFAAGVLAYKHTVGGSNGGYIRVVNPAIYVQSNSIKAGDIVGGCVAGTGIGGEMLVNGGSIYVENYNAGASVDIACFYNAVDGSNNYTMRGIGTYCEAVNAGAGGAYSAMTSTDPQALIELNVFSNAATNDGTGANINPATRRTT